MKHVAPPIGLAETQRGMLVSLPPRIWLVVGLRKSFRGVRAAAEPWTYLVPGRAKRLGEWIAEVELQLLTERRRRLWSASEAEWTGVAPAAAAPIAAEPVVVVLPKTRTARPVLELIQSLAAGERLVVDVAGDGRVYRLSPSGRRIAPGIADRAIGQRLIVPSCDGLFGPEWSQTWRAPTREELDASEQAPDPKLAPRKRRKTPATPPAAAPETHRRRAGPRARPAKSLARDVARPEAARAGGGVG